MNLELLSIFQMHDYIQKFNVDFERKIDRANILLIIHNKPCF